MLTRIIFTAFLFISAFVMPWWITLLITISASFYFKNFYEAVFIGLVLDSFFGSQVVFDNFSYIITLALFISVLFINHIRQKLIMY